ncbi:phosphodiester glycosidase family protein [Nocardioides sp. HM23]|uniref:phosphodiester glycosidase family protein n=1 Tax=Nocardioides bizhenqiangii TaxID=3095076 RepID=UPI002ACA59AE|nr:phosphodiester glycosidase family protein [Nocardioides sp. HM23]MDZ5621989.1 phosphodiester glycosidase family protein [Nocardioides sp. HM23]
MRRLLPELVVLSLLATAGAVVFLDDGPSDPSKPPAAQQAAAPRVAPGSDPDDPQTWQTSDQVRGPIAPPAVPGQRAVLGRTQRFSYKPAPGVTITAWDARTRRGPVRYFVTRVRWRAPGIRVDYSNGDRVRRRQTVTSMLSSTPKVVAGINGDFFDIYDTGAPLGIGRERRGDVLWNAIDSGWNNALSVNTEGKWHLGELPLVAEVVDRPGIVVTNYNSPRVKVGGTGIYDWRFGRAVGYGWTDEQRRQVRFVQIVDGTVVANREALPSRTGIKGIFLIARGDHAEDKLEALKVGTRVAVRRRLGGKVAVAITGNALLIKKRQLLVSDDGEMHPRTAVGVDRDTKELIFLVVDGRQDFSRGFTMVELGRMMMRLGAEDALNLDGGGSTTLAAVRNGDLRVINSPSDGAQRPVPNGLEVVYNP